MSDQNIVGELLLLRAEVQLLRKENAERAAVAAKAAADAQAPPPPLTVQQQVHAAEARGDWAEALRLNNQMSNEIAVNRRAEIVLPADAATRNAELAKEIADAFAAGDMAKHCALTNEQSNLINDRRMGVA